MTNFITFDLPGDEYISGVSCSNNDSCIFHSNLRSGFGSPWAYGSGIWHGDNNELEIGCGRNDQDNSKTYKGVSVKEISHRNVDANHDIVNLKVTLQADKTVLQKIKTQAKACGFKVK